MQDSIPFFAVGHSRLPERSRPTPRCTRPDHARSPRQHRCPPHQNVLPKSHEARLHHPRGPPRQGHPYLLYPRPSVATTAHCLGRLLRHHGLSGDAPAGPSDTRHPRTGLPPGRGQRVVRRTTDPGTPRPVWCLGPHSREVVTQRKRNRFMCYDLRNGKTLMPVVRDRGDAPRDTKHKPH